MDNSPAFHPLDYVSVLRRRMWWLIVPVVLAAIIGAVLVQVLPRRYEANAAIGVSLPSMMGRVLSDSQRVSNEERMRSINQVLMSEPVLQRVAREEGLDKQAPLADAVQAIRSGVVVRVPPQDGNLPAGTVEKFIVAFTGDTPQVTQRITNRLANVFVEESSRKRELRAEESSAFVSKQLQASKERLDQLETQLLTAKQAYMGALPEHTQTNVSMMAGAQQQLESSVNAMRGEQDRLASVERQIEMMKGGVSSDSAGSAVPAAPSGPNMRVVELERQLATARNLYTDKHPEIVRLREDLAAARAEARAEASRPEEDRMATLRANPAYLALVRAQQESVFRIRDMQRQQAALQSQISLYRTRVESAPRVEQQITPVAREYELEKTNYTTLSQRLREAQAIEGVERSQGGERFVVVTPASLPSTPVSPKTQRLMLITLMLGICIGGGLALGREYLDRAVHDARALNDLDVPVLGEIPRIAHA